ncbi:hypothetical protein [Streptomyces sp. NRRL S-1022]|uniref:hypothetical protein n=1 Tax=Streptomyces sp. NRRL S-1022 TaxID=1463880 RepID=UPI0004BFE0C8|nr:hypothetical protein [Streptomyces sp. NRRL S-1022]
MDEGGRAKWSGFGPDRVRSFSLTRAAREVLLGADPPVRLTRRGEAKLAEAREAHLAVVHPAGTVMTRRSDDDVRWWTWAGHRANATLAASLPSVVLRHRFVDDRFVRLRDDVTRESWRTAVADAGPGLAWPFPRWTPVRSGA